MNLVADTERELFDFAFNLAYFIHVNKEIAFFIAEDALDALSSTLGYQKKNRTSENRLRGFLKWGERTRPVRKTVMLQERQMLQWLVYRESAQWERRTELGQGPYLPNEEDLIVRYLEHLIFLTVRRNSFYVTLAIGSLLHQFDRRETRLFHDILTQSDSARMKDTNYIGKQRLELLERVFKRFEGMIRVEKRVGEEKQFQMRATTDWIIALVNESLRRFTPAQTDCSIGTKFDATDIPALYFADDAGNDEDEIEMRRVHTVVDPACFRRFCDGLASYVASLPSADLDSACSFSSPDKRLALPQFSNFQSGPKRSDRFQPKQLTNEDYIRLQRMLDARGSRKKNFVAQRVLIYVDGLLSNSFAPQDRRGVFCTIPPGNSFIEVRGRDAKGEITLATLILDDKLPQNQFEDSIIHPGGQRVRLTTRPFTPSSSEPAGIIVEVTYTERVSGFIDRARASGRRFLTPARGRDQTAWPILNWRFIWLVSTLAIMLMASLLTWRHFQRLTTSPPLASVEEPSATQSPETLQSNEPTNNSSSPLRQNPLESAPAIVAEVKWNLNPDSALNAIAVEATRSQKQTLRFSKRRTKVTLSLPIYDGTGDAFLTYRVTLFGVDRSLWEKTLRPPSKSVTGYTHLLDVVLFSNDLPKANEYQLQVTGRTVKGWRKIGIVSWSTLLD